MDAEVTSGSERGRARQGNDNIWYLVGAIAGIGLIFLMVGLTYLIKGPPEWSPVGFDPALTISQSDLESLLREDRIARIATKSDWTVAWTEEGEMFSGRDLDAYAAIEAAKEQAYIVGVDIGGASLSRDELTSRERVLVWFYVIFGGLVLTAVVLFAVRNPDGIGLTRGNEVMQDEFFRVVGCECQNTL